MKYLIIALLGLILTGGDGLTAYAQTATARKQATVGNEALLKKLPPALREQGRLFFAETDERKRAKMAEDLAEDEPAAVDFLLALLKTESDARVRRRIIEYLRAPLPAKAVQAFTQLVANDGNAKIALVALERLRKERHRDLKQMLDQHIAQARTSGDQETLRALADE